MTSLQNDSRWSLSIARIFDSLLVSSIDYLVAIVIDFDLVNFINADWQLFMSQSFLRSLSHQKFWSSRILILEDFDRQRFLHQWFWFSEILIVKVLCRTLDSFDDFQLNDISINKFDQSVAEFWLRHCICEIDIFVNSSDLCNFSSLVRLSQAH